MARTAANPRDCRKPARLAARLVCQKAGSAGQLQPKATTGRTGRQAAATASPQQCLVRLFLFLLFVRLYFWLFFLLFLPLAFLSALRRRAISCRIARFAFVRGR